MANSQTITLMLKAIGDFSDVTSNVKQVQSVLNQIKVPKNLQESFTGIFDDLTAETKKYQKFLDSGFKKKSDVTGLEASGARINNLLKRLKVEMGKISQEDLTKSFQIDPSKLQNLTNEAKNLQNQLQAAMSTTQVQNYTNAVDAAAKEMAKASKTDFAKNFADAFKKGDLEGARAALADINKQVNRFKSGSDNFNKYSAGAKAMEDALDDLVKNTNIEDLTQKIKDNQVAMQGLGTTEMNAYIKAFEDGKIDVEQFTSAVKVFTNTQKDSANATHQQVTELDQLKDRAKHFLSLANGVQLFKRAIRDTVNTVKELDKTMTEAAVVTEFSISDMWDKLPQYAKAASALGISINDMYQATTLYYQQGLKTQEAMEIGVETMKMAKIAAMDSTEATKAMTAALRGFNMELNETSATRVNDVYSQLAAVTAADVGQISTAMEKTASIAASANMEFETTAALLAQIIETTQEAPETAGTAMKTIIARFSEVKSLRERGETTGKDEEGEDIDVNRIQTALRSVGISMEGFFDGTEGLDSILLKLAKKWKNLDFETQRYIATMAAGSRQQSRFIAMMSDYERTTQLVSYAQNSVGASQAQFEKTTESLETALNRLKTAWEQFTMSIANESFIKFAIDSLTSVLEGINKITSAVSSLGKIIPVVGGALGPFTSLITAIGAFKFGRIAVGGLFGNTKLGQKIGLKDKASKTAPTSPQSKPAGFKQSMRDTYFQNRKVYANADVLKADLLTKAGQTGVDQQALDKLKTDLDNAGDSVEGIDQAMGEFNDTAAKAGKGFVNVGKAAQSTGGQIQKTTPKFDKLGATLMGAGMACGLLGSAFKAMGLDEGAEAVETLSGVLMTAGSALLVFSMIIGPATQGMKMFTAEWWRAVLPIMAVIGAILALVAVIGLIVQAINYNPIAEEMEKAEEATKAAAKAADEAKQAYDELLQDKDQYKILQDRLNNLTKGTKEWREALLEANEQIIQMADKNPKLWDSIGYGAYGQLTIDQKALEDAETEAFNKRLYASSAAQAQALRSEKAKLALELQGMGVTEEQLEKILNGEDLTITHELTYAGGSVTKTISEEDAAKAKQAYDVSKAQQDSLAYGTLSILSDELSSDVIGQALLEGMAKNYDEDKGISEKKASVILEDGTSQEIAALLGDEIDKNYYDSLEAGLTQTKYLYEQLIGEVPDELAENEEMLLNEVGKALAAKETVKWLEKINDTLQKQGKNTGKYAALLSGNNDLFKVKDLQEGFNFSAEDVETATGLTIKEQIQFFGFETEEQLYKYYGKRQAEMDSLYNDTFQYLQGLGGGADQALQLNNGNISFQQAKAIGEAISMADARNGAYAGPELPSLISDIISKTTGANRDEVMNLIAAEDWADKNSIDSTISALRDLGVTIDNEFVKSIYEATGAVRKFDAAKIESRLAALAEIDDILDEKIEDGSSTFSKEEMQKFIDQGYGQDSFVRVGYDEYVLVKPLDELKKAVEENTAAMLDEDIAGAKKSLKIAENYENLINSEKKTKEGTYGEILSKIIDGSLSSNSISFSTLKDMASMLGLNTFGLTTEQIFGLIKENYSHYENRVATQGSLNQLETDAATMSAYNNIGEASFVESSGTSLALDAYIQQNQGLEIAVEKATEQIATENSALAEQEKLIKNLVVRNSKTTKSIKTLTDTINDQADALKIANMNNLDYQTALSQISKQASEVFGMEVSEKFVDQNRELFMQWAEGGKGGQQAYEKLGRSLTEAYLDGLNLADGIKEQVFKAFDDFVPPGIEVGMTFPATDLFNTLEKILGDANEAAAVMQGMGYSMTFETKWINDQYPGVLFDDMDENRGGVETPVKVATATKTDAGGGYKGGGGGSSNNYDNGYDRLHNTLQEINDTLRERERLERQYQRLLNQNLATAEKLSNISQQNIAGYQFEISKQKDIIAGRLAQIEGEKLGNPDLQNLIYTETGRDGNQSIRINWEGLQAIKDADAGERTDEYYDRIQGWLESIYEAQTAIEEAQDAIYEEMLQGKDEYLELEEQVKEAIINERQKEIDKLSAINDSINDTNSKLLESMQQQLDEYRQNRDNAKTEDEIADKQRRLAYLQQDTSGANAKEILDLQKEIDESQESYTDQLIDQKISELQQQNDKAAEQRQQQIDIMQAQLDKYSESSEIWEDVAELVAEGTSAAEGLVSGSELETLLKSSEAFAGMSKIQKMDWLNQINNQLAAALKWMSDGAVASMNVGKTITFTAKGNSTPITGTVNEQGQVITEDGAVFNKVSMDAYGNYSTSETMSEALNNQEAEQESKINQEEIAMFPYGKPTQISAQPTYGESSGLIKALQHALNAVGNYNLTVDGVWGNKTLNAVNAFRGANGLSAWNTPWEDVMKTLEDKVKEALKGKINLSQYKTGGLADFTGPAWLDGTKSRPEYILNADQTKAFFNLVDVLGSLQTSSFKTAQNSGDNTYDIDINVESIGSDYDVEQLATTVKRLINEDARYRNNNTINLTR